MHSIPCQHEVILFQFAATRNARGIALFTHIDLLSDVYGIKDTLELTKVKLFVNNEFQEDYFYLRNICGSVCTGSHGNACTGS